jgi:DNA-binding beta-propeller fold protein YncE
MKRLAIILSVCTIFVLNVDMKAGKVIHETPLGGNPRRPFFDPATNELWVDNGDTAVAIS